MELKYYLLGLLFSYLNILVASLSYSGLSFIPDVYESKSKGPRRFICRNVPGYGSCLFYALAACITHERCKFHIEFTCKNMKEYAINLRRKAVEILNSGNEERELYLEDESETISAKELLEIVANHSNTTPEEYCKEMLLSTTWGSGSEIVALCHHFKRPIHVYELDKPKPSKIRYLLSCILPFIPSYSSSPPVFKLKLQAGFGSKVYDQKEPLYILCADGRFPDILPGKQKDIGDHFLALFPLKDNEYKRYYKQAYNKVKRRLKGYKKRVMDGKSGLGPRHLRAYDHRLHSIETSGGSGGRDEVEEGQNYDLNMNTTNNKHSLLQHIYNKILPTKRNIHTHHIRSLLNTEIVKNYLYTCQQNKYKQLNTYVSSTAETENGGPEPDFSPTNILESDDEYELCMDKVFEL